MPDESATMAGDLHVVTKGDAWTTMDEGDQVLIEGALVTIDLDHVLLEISENERAIIVIQSGVMFMLDLLNESMMVGSRRRIQATVGPQGWLTTPSDVMQMKPRAGLYVPDTGSGSKIYSTQVQKTTHQHQEPDMAISDLDATFDPPKSFVPIDDAARDGQRQLVRKNDGYAVAQWTGEFWSYPYGPGDDESNTAIEIDFEPTHYSPKTPGGS